MPEFEIREERGWVIYRNGERIVDTSGDPCVYGSEEEARYVVEHWDRFRAPTYAELKGMSSADLEARLS